VQVIYSLLKLIRVHNCLLAGVGVWMGWYLTGHNTGKTEALIASLAAALVCGAGNAFNDYIDIEIDRVNHPTRPLPRGDIPPYLAVLTMLVFDIIAVGLSIMVNAAVLLVVIGAVVLLLVYNLNLKKQPLSGNVAVSLLGAATFMVGGLAVNTSNIGMLPGPLVPAVFAFLFHFGRELVKDTADCEGDRRAGFKTLAAMVSQNVMLALIAAVYLILIFLTYIPVYYDWFRPVFNYIVMVGVDLPLLISVLYLLISRNRDRFKNASNILKVLMLIGLIAFLLGRNPGL